MINLVPKEEKKKMRKGFYLRLLLLSFVVLDIVSIIALVVILPSHFLSSIKASIANTKLEAQKKEPIAPADQEMLALAKDLNDKLRLVENAENAKFETSKRIINAVLSNKLSSIKISNISYENDAQKGKRVSVEGTAPSREVLLLFNRALEDDGAFKQVDLPISNFVKGSNIEFYLSLIPS